MYSLPKNVTYSGSGISKPESRRVTAGNLVDLIREVVIRSDSLHFSESRKRDSREAVGLVGPDFRRIIPHNGGRREEIG